MTDHHDLVYHTAFGITGNRRHADDVLQSLFVMLLCDGLSAELKSNPARWLHRAAVGVSVTVVRNGSLEGGDCREQFLTTIAGMKVRPLEILLLHYKHHYSDKQIAALLGTSRSTISVTLSRLRVRLRKAFVAGRCDQDGTGESIPNLFNRRVPSPSHFETAVSREWIRERVRSLPPHLTHARLADIAAIVSWWRSGRRL